LHSKIEELKPIWRKTLEWFVRHGVMFFLPGVKDIWDTISDGLE
jgi:hypothetical protein